MFKQSKGVLASSGLFGEVAGAGGAIIALGARRGASFGRGSQVFFFKYSDHMRYGTLYDLQ